MSEEKMTKRTEKKPGCSRLALTIISLVLVVMTGVSGILGYNLLKAYRMNRYSKNIWLDNTYFLARYDDDETQEADSVNTLPSAPADSEVMAQTEEINADNINPYIDQTIYDLYINGQITDAEVDRFYDIYSSGDTETAVEYINNIVNENVFAVSLFTKKLSVPYVSQEGILPNGCEAVSAVMLLKDRKFNVDPVDFVDKYLDCGKVYVKWGCRYGPDPRKQYAGDPKSEKGGWGCFAPVIVNSLNKYLSDSKYYACNLTGKNIGALAADYVSKGIPVAVWCTIGMQEINEIYQWQSYDKKQTYLYPVRQHCMVLIGYDAGYYYCLDPYNSNGEVKYPKEQTEYCFNSMGKQAVAILESK
ncbi:MAG: C39 family peptidase [Acutalibacteraceae bacterium]